MIGDEDLVPGRSDIRRCLKAMLLTTLTARELSNLNDRCNMLPAAREGEVLELYLSVAMIDILFLRLVFARPANA